MRRRWRLPRLPWPRPRTARGRRWRTGGVAAFLLLLLWWLQTEPRQSWPHAQILAAIRQVESSGRDDVADGDGGKAIGPFQIHFVYWQDALRAEPTLGGSYPDCRRRAYAERVVVAYMQKYARDAWANGDAETIARVHNGGPDGADKQATLGYWQRVRRHLP
ncbi:MAG: hypothetical protein JNK15_18610 [Planctomycetes bacterium]|nr:hypothetical protein [Planctomycetota bacterium]